MRQTLWTLATLLSHWRRHPANLATLLVGLAIATALWSGVQALNDHARKSYASAAAAVSGADARALVSTRGGLFAQDLYIKLRLAGWKVSPVLEGTVRVGDKSLRRYRRRAPDSAARRAARQSSRGGGDRGFS